ncbi:ABC transporter ATP-binding protein [Enorma phocaeensis]|uniref:ABC transporter ATP-binding protein n=1 Tax=Enorma phocaeensis TaxID=1871019 RepID=UPI001957A3B8|nr:ABC transporter ATP-binding protein [Enorma phocaeensis]MBM6953538.1 ABC transporter ATP-binding protein [Enorma phocaeensis]
MHELRRIVGFLGQYRRDAVIGILLVVIESAFEMVIPILMADIIDVGVARRDVDYIVRQGMYMGVCAVLSLVTGLMYARFAARASYGLGAHLRAAEYERVQGYSFTNLDHFETSSLVTRMTTDVTVIQNALNAGFRPMVRGPVMLVIGFALAFYLNTELALVFVAVAPVMAVALVLIVRHVGPLYGVLQRTVDRLNDVVQEMLTAVRAVKAYVRGDYECEQFRRVNEELAGTSEHTFRFAVLNMPVLYVSMYTVTTLIMWFGGQMILGGALAVGELTGFLSYVMQIMNSLIMISNVFLLLTRSLASIHRICEVLDEPVDLASPEHAATEVEDGSIEFRDVSFKYRADAQANVLEHVTLSIPAGSTVGVLGGTGSGKTTLVQLIPRLYDATEGEVMIGGRNVREYDVAALRDAVAIVLQKNVLFSGTVRENLLWGDAHATTGELLEACRQARVDEFLDRLPGGLDYDLGQGGVNVSGGQKQRLCIARALLKRPKVLIFDDSTSAVDMATEADIRSALASLTGVTKVIIAQRVSSVMEADQIVVLDDGRVHAVGTHAELLASDNIYQEIYASQTKQHGPCGDGGAAARAGAVQAADALVGSAASPHEEATSSSHGQLDPSKGGER